jgi:hypothetical protein
MSKLMFGCACFGCWNLGTIQLQLIVGFTNYGIVNFIEFLQYKVYDNMSCIYQNIYFHTSPLTQISGKKGTTTTQI